MALADAVRGIRTGLVGHHHMRVHLVTTILVGAVGLWLGLSPVEWALIVLAAGGVWTAELLNSSVEEMVDLVQPNHDPRAGRSKDLAAGAVLAASIAAALVGFLILGPKLWQRVTHEPAPAAQRVS